MDQDNELSGMDIDQLREALARTEASLEDVDEEREFTLGQTGVHIGANELARLRKAWEKDETRLKVRLAAITARLAELEIT